MLGDLVALAMTSAQAEKAMEALAWGWTQGECNDPDEARAEEMSARLQELHGWLHYARYPEAPVGIEDAA